MNTTVKKCMFLALMCLSGLSCGKKSEQQSEKAALAQKSEEAKKSPASSNQKENGEAPKNMTYAEKYSNMYAFMGDLRGFFNQKESGWDENRFRKFVDRSGSGVTLDDVISAGGNLEGTDFSKAANLSGKCFLEIGNQKVDDMSDCDAAEGILTKYDYMGIRTKITQLERAYLSSGISLFELHGPGTEQVKRLGFIKKINCNPKPVVGDIQPASFAQIDYAQWSELDCEKKIAAINQIGHYCGRLTSLIRDDNPDIGLGIWSPESGSAQVYGQDNCGTVH